ncbi:hypothetical protein SAMN02910453_1889 [Lachnospiraceae bacterium A10]|nr:hypothetical protein SAMN02910453_1889 [Lachnospiraceae bacterium A10]
MKKTTNKAILWLQAILIPTLLIAILTALQALSAVAFPNITEDKMLTIVFCNIAEAIFLILTLVFFKILHRDILGKQKHTGFFMGLLVGGYLTFTCIIRIPVLIAPYFAEGDVVFNPISYFLLYLVYTLLIGASEEFLFRGIVFDICQDIFGNKRKGMYLSLIASSVIFGLMHMTNALGADLSGVIVQAISAAVLGFLLGAIYYRTGNIWVVAFLHGLNDFTALIGIALFDTEDSLVNQISSYGWQQLAGLPIILLIALFLLRKSKTYQFNDDYVPADPNPENPYAPEYK